MKTSAQQQQKSNVQASAQRAQVVGVNVKRLRQRANINKKTLCLMVGIGRPFLNRIEKGEANVRISVLECLAAALDTTPQDLLTPPYETWQSHQSKLTD